MTIFQHVSQQCTAALHWFFHVQEAISVVEHLIGRHISKPFELPRWHMLMDLWQFRHPDMFRACLKYTQLSLEILNPLLVLWFLWRTFCIHQWLPCGYRGPSFWYSETPHGAHRRDIHLGPSTWWPNTGLSLWAFWLYRQSNLLVEFKRWSV